MKISKISLISISLLILFSLLLINSTLFVKGKSDQNILDSHKVFQLRTYVTHDGKLDDLHQRFENHTMELFEKHGMKNIGYWSPVDKENTLIYIVAHESRETAEASWEAFRNDPVWQEAYEASRENGPLVKNIESVFMTSTEYSPLK